MVEGALMVMLLASVPPPEDVIAPSGVVARTPKLANPDRWSMGAGSTDQPSATGSSPIDDPIAAPPIIEDDEVLE
jgi:hypothetical protein